MKTKNYKPNKVSIVTLGCSKNTVDSEVLQAQLEAGDVHTVHEDAKDADTIIINTCGFIDNAKQESIDTILAYADEKKAGNIENLIVTGCLSERYKEDLSPEIPEVDKWYGTFELPQLLNQVGVDYRKELLGERKSSVAKHFAYMKISEGCDRPCSFCAIPLMRGGHVSKPIDDLVNEAKALVRDGVKEIMLIAQDSTYYGIDLYGERRLHELMDRLSDVEGLEWIRLHYAYPSKFPFEILPVMNSKPNICKYLDIPIQHISDNVLKSMRRGITKRRTEEVLDRIKSEVDGIALRTTLLLGHPGEYEEDFEDILNFVEHYKFNRLGVFTYSHEEGTHAGTLEDHVPADVKAARAEAVMNLQHDISMANNELLVGTKQRVLIDRIEGDSYIGRTQFDSPEVDNEVIISLNEGYMRVGDFVDTLITGAEAFDLMAKLDK
ncbi:MAG: 30S ribosomal protein S12 methylthiotransferase RimO [Bacteroidetes bacterium]|jgi:ribosomal protein S12 methylthiotransferase|nr:30S ribosomal protein S12 methylthiotransferase RimO [Bacteroidota bacterium]